MKETEKTDFLDPLVLVAKIKYCFCFWKIWKTGKRDM